MSARYGDLRAGRESLHPAEDTGRTDPTVTPIVLRIARSRVHDFPADESSALSLAWSREFRIASTHAGVVARWRGRSTRLALRASPLDERMEWMGYPRQQPVLSGRRAFLSRASTMTRRRAR